MGMSKTIRNTLFTALILVLTGLGVSWNEDIARQKTPVAIGETVLAEFSAAELASGDLSLEVDLSRQTILLGQYQVVTIQTLPFADLDLALRLPDGQFDASQTTRKTADELGRYRWRFQVDDFQSIGRMEVLVKAGLGAQRAAIRQAFVVQTWNLAAPKEEFVYPILP